MPEHERDERRAEAPHPDDLKRLESKNGVTGLDTVDCRRLLANNARLRQLVLDAAKILEHSRPANEDERQVYVKLKDEAER